MKELPSECGECLHNHQDLYLYCGHQGAGKSGIVPEVRICPANGRPEWCPLVDNDVIVKGGWMSVKQTFQYEGLDKIEEIPDYCAIGIIEILTDKCNEVTRVVNRLTEIANSEIK